MPSTSRTGQCRSLVIDTRIRSIDLDKFMLHMQHELVQSLEGGKTPLKEISKGLGWRSIRSGRLASAQPG